jgi:hypothetical protein
MWHVGLWEKRETYVVGEAEGKTSRRDRRIILKVILKNIVWGCEQDLFGSEYGPVMAPVKVKFSSLQALEALRVVRGWGSHIF